MSVFKTISLLFLLVLQSTQAQDVARIVLLKEALYQQITSREPALVNPPYHFLAQVQATPATNLVELNGVSLLLPGGNSMSLIKENDSLGYSLQSDYISIGGLNGELPDGTYTLTILAVHDGKRTVPLTFTGDSFPNPPRIVNYDETQAVDTLSDSDFVVRWSPFSGGTAADFVSFQAIDYTGKVVVQSPSFGKPGALTGVSDPSFTVRANTLGSGLLCRIQFVHFATVDQTSYGHGVVSTAGYATQTESRLVPLPPPAVSLITLMKGHKYIQNPYSTADIVPDYHNPYSLQGDVYTRGSLSNDVANLQVPGGNTITIFANDFSSLHYGLAESHVTQGGLDGDFPDGTYTWAVADPHYGARSIPLSLTGDQYPNPPHVSNVDFADNSFVFYWDPFAGGDNSDYISFKLLALNTDEVLFKSPELGEPGALTGLSRSYRISAGSLPQYTYFYGLLRFVHLGETNDSSYGRGVKAYAGYFSETEFFFTPNYLTPDYQPPPPLTPAVSGFALAKGAAYSQTGTNAPSLATDKPYQFRVLKGSGYVESESVILPSGTNVLASSTPGYAPVLEDQFDTVQELDTNYPTGNYTVTFNTVQDGTRSVTLPLPSSIFPEAPRILNFAAAQVVDPSLDFTIIWSALTNGTFSDLVQMRIASQDDNQEVFETPFLSLNGTSNSTTIPALTLTPGRSYWVRVLFGKTLAFGSSYTRGSSAYFSETQMPLITIGTAFHPTLSVVSTSSGLFKLHANGTPGRTYIVESTASLIAPVEWQKVGQYLGLTTGIDLTYNVVPGQVFYRVRDAN